MRLRSLGDDDAEVFGTAAGHGADRGAPLIEVDDLDGEDVRRVEARQRETGETFGDAALALGLVGDDALSRAVERQQNFYVLAPGDKRVDPLVVAAFHPTDPLAQAARRLRADISAARDGQGDPLRLLMVLAVKTRAEAALVVANLAVACAQAGHRTLLVDANLDDPIQHGLFRVGNGSGLSVLLARHDVGDAIRQTAINGLSILPAGPSMRHFAEMLDRAALHGRLREVGGEFDLVLVDASIDDPAVAVAAAEKADGAMIVVRRDDSSMQEVTALIEQLQARDTPVLGTVLTN